jgi:drug/metabolite transporter (DMT)-like permease
MSHQKNLPLAVFLTLLSFFFMATNSALVKLINGRVNPFQILHLQNLFCLISILIFVLLKLRKITFFKTDHMGLILTRTVASLTAFFFIFVSLRHLSLVDATLLVNTSPFFIPFLLLLFLKESINHRLWWGVVLGFAGIIVILNPTATIFQWYALLPLISSISQAVIFISLRRLHHYQEPTTRILLYLYLFGTVLTLPFGIYEWQPPSPTDWIYLVMVGATSFLSQTAITIGLRYGTPKALRPLCYSSVVFALFFDWSIWKTIPSWTSAIGIVLVIIGGIIALLIENRSETPVSNAEFK